MSEETRNYIVQVLTQFLNRPPTEQEIMNATTDVNIMNKVMFLKLGMVL